MVGNIPALGGPNRNTGRAIKLDPNVYYEYIVNPPPGHNGPGPSAAVWTGVISGLPSDTTFEWSKQRAGSKQKTAGVITTPSDPASSAMYPKCTLLNSFSLGELLKWFVESLNDSSDILITVNSFSTSWLRGEPSWPGVIHADREVWITPVVVITHNDTIDKAITEEAFDMIFA